jgi:hypothetical protein
MKKALFFMHLRSVSQEASLVFVQLPAFSLSMLKPRTSKLSTRHPYSFVSTSISIVDAWRIFAKGSVPGEKNSISLWLPGYLASRCPSSLPLSRARTLHGLEHTMVAGTPKATLTVPSGSMRISSVPFQPLLSTDANRSITPAFGSGKLEYFHCAKDGVEAAHRARGTANH